MDHMYIRHTVGGRLFLDTNKDSLNYTLEKVDGYWKFTIDLPPEDITDEILRNRDNLNIFVVADGQVNQKTWYYTRGGLVERDDARHKLIILADFKLDYPT